MSQTGSPEPSRLKACTNSDHKTKQQRILFYERLAQVQAQALRHITTTTMQTL